VLDVGETLAVPDVALAPLQPLEAVHDVALVVDQVSVELEPEVIEEGEALMVTTGAGVPAVTVMVVELDALPPAPVHVSV
jgi:hypothetical protein